MKKTQVRIGETYVCKVSGRLAEVRIDSVCPYGGWWATNTQTRRQVRIRSAQRLRAPVRTAAKVGIGADAASG